MPLFFSRPVPEEMIHWTGDNFAEVETYVNTNGGLVVENSEDSSLDMDYSGYTAHAPLGSWLRGGGLTVLSNEDFLQQYDPEEYPTDVLFKWGITTDAPPA
jgi:hypothetical protein